jgi:uncharacterized integral membrane protein
MNDRTDDIESTDIRAVHRRDAGRIFRFVLAVALVVALMVVALDNTDDVRVGYAFGDANAPVWMVLVISAAAGIVIGWLVRHRPHRHT